MQRKDSRRRLTYGRNFRIENSWDWRERSYKCADTFEIANDEVEFTGDEYWGYSGHEKHSGEFPLKFIYTSDEEIKKYVSDTLAERECKQRRLEAEAELLKLERERAEYEMLKKKFEVE